MMRSNRMRGAGRPAAGMAVLLAAFLAVLLAATGGCTQSIAWLAAQFTPPKKIDPLYEMPKDKKILVLVEDRPAPVSYEPIKYELAERLSKKLRENKVARETIPFERLQDLATTKDFSQIPVSEIGQRLGADLVLYVQIDTFALKDNPYTPLWQGKLTTSVWLVDARKPERLWPKDVPTGSGYHVPPLEFKPTEEPSPTYGEEIAKALAEQMADRIAQVFYTHYEETDRFHDNGPKPGQE